MSWEHTCHQLILRCSDQFINQLKTSNNFVLYKILMDNYPIEKPVCSLMCSEDYILVGHGISCLHCIEELYLSTSLIVMDLLLYSLV
jgi:hypothetical protein